MIELRRSDERGHADHGWLNTYHTFSFAEYYDPGHMGFRSLRVLNEDRVQPGMGFPTHGHRDMEIISYVVEGALEHRDSLGTGSVIRPGDVQKMSAGTGVQHSEFNASRSEPVHFLQIWILPEQTGLTPGYQQKHFGDEEKKNRLRLIASPDGREGSVVVRQDVSLFAALVDPGQKIEHAPADGRHAWVQVVRGRLSLNGHELQAGDGASVSGESRLTLAALERAEVLLFDLA